MRQLLISGVVIGLGACDACNPNPLALPTAHTPTAGELRETLGFDLPANATEVVLEDLFVGMYGAKTVVTFTLPTADRPALIGVMPCELVNSRCVWRHLHTEQTIDLRVKGVADLVTITTEDYDPCVFDGCKP